MNIFIIGFLIFVGVIAYWILPNMITYLGRTGLDALVRFKWVFIGLGIVVVGIGVWIVYLRYLLAKKSIESQTEIEKHRLSLEYRTKTGTALQLDAPSPEKGSQASLQWDRSGDRHASTSEPR
jgi:hypothetical protein